MNKQKRKQQTNGCQMRGGVGVKGEKGERD